MSPGTTLRRPPGFTFLDVLSGAKRAMIRRCAIHGFSGPRKSVYGISCTVAHSDRSTQSAGGTAVSSGVPHPRSAPA